MSRARWEGSGLQNRDDRVRFSSDMRRIQICYNVCMAYKDPLDERAKEARRKHYYNNKEQYFKRNADKKTEMKEYLKKIKDVPCMDCGVKYPSYVMDLDHRNPIEKIANINQIISSLSWSKFFEEIAKCDVVCANCHRQRTHGLNS